MLSVLPASLPLSPVKQGALHRPWEAACPASRSSSSQRHQRAPPCTYQGINGSPVIFSDSFLDLNIQGLQDTVDVVDEVLQLLDGGTAWESTRKRWRASSKCVARLRHSMAPEHTGGPADKSVGPALRGGRPHLAVSVFLEYSDKQRLDGGCREAEGPGVGIRDLRNCWGLPVSAHGQQL